MSDLVVLDRSQRQRRVHQEPGQDHSEGLVGAVLPHQAMTHDKVYPEIEKFKPRILKTYLSKAHEDEPQAVLQKRAQPAA